jgi:hypothetical protein
MEIIPAPKRLDSCRFRSGPMNSGAHNASLAAEVYSSQVLSPPGGPKPFSSRIFCTVGALTAIPMRRNVWDILFWPQPGFSRLRVRTSSTISARVGGRPPRVWGAERFHGPCRNLVAQRWIVRGEPVR